MFTTLITADQLDVELDKRRCVVVDCRFDLMDTEQGRRAYAQAHIPTAVYAHLDDDLSGPPTTDHGRHPLPPAERMREVFGRLGIREAVQVIAYDDSNGAIAGRFWWMLRYLGHKSVAVLDGGWNAWVETDRSVNRGTETAKRVMFHGQPRRDRLVTVEAVSGALRLVDARDPARYRGENEPIDPRAGHIPGALNHFWQRNLTVAGQFLGPDGLWAEFERSLGTLPDEDTVHYCGSGVSACHNVLAQVHAGLPEPRLYCGSWSEWCRDRDRPVALGD
jgi:thiosulfate/3-mercaptopyruvate sulfurtransferase